MQTTEDIPIRSLYLSWKEIYSSNSIPLKLSSLKNLSTRISRKTKSSACISDKQKDDSLVP